MIAGATIDLAFQWILPGFPVWQGKPALHRLHLFKQFYVNDYRMMVGNNEPLVPVLPATPCAAHFNDRTTSNDMEADIAFVF